MSPQFYFMSVWVFMVSCRWYGEQCKKSSSSNISILKN